MSIRTAVFAGSFYPADPGTLREEVDGYLNAAGSAGPLPKALIVPHAGYIYSGPVAASAYARLRQGRGRVRRVVIVGPSHRCWFTGLALPEDDAFASPLGVVPVDAAAAPDLLQLPQVHRREDAHADEHSLEVHLPFLQRTLGEFSIVPIVVGEASPREVGEVLERVWGGPETLVVVSSDLSHFETYEAARERDAATVSAMEALRPGGVADGDACGAHAVNGLLWLAGRKGLRIAAVDVRSSGDTAGPRDRVVGYAALVVGERAAPEATSRLSS